MMTSEQVNQIFDRADERLSKLRHLNYKPFAATLTELERSINEFCEAGRQLLAEGDTLQIGIVGQVKAGKSSFLNSLFFEGENILPRASTPMTAGLTVLEYAEKNTFEVEYFSAKDWQLFTDQHANYKAIEAECRAHDPDMPANLLRREIDSRASETVRSAYEMVEACNAAAQAKVGAPKDVVSFGGHADLQNVLEKYVGANGQFTSVVKSLYVKLNDERLKGLRIVDTPGVNDPVVSRENRTRTFLHACHGVFLLTSSSDFFGSTDVSFLNNRIGTQGIAKVVLLASKFDSVLQDLGAEREMKGLPADSLSHAAEVQFYAFQRRLNDLKGTVKEELRDNIALNYTSGISYGLAHKPESRWDSMEQNVAQQMKRYYPADFSTLEMGKNNFAALANIEDIRTEYMEQLFLQNKEAIISNKINDFFKAQTHDLRAQFEDGQRELEQKVNDLKTKTLADIEAQTQAQKKVFSKLSNKFNDEISKFNSGLQSRAVAMVQNIHLPSTIEVPQSGAEATIRHKGMVYGHNNTQMEYASVNAYALKLRLDQVIDAYLREFNESWGEVFREQQDHFTQQMTDLIISTSSNLGATTAFDDDFYLSLVSRVINSTGVKSTIDFFDLESRFKQAADSIAHSDFVPRDYSEMKKDAAFTALRNDAQTFVRQVGQRVSNELLMAIKSEVRNRVNQYIGQITADMEAVKGQFATNLEREANEYLSQLRSELERQTESLREVETYKAAYDSLAELFNA